MFCQLSGVCIPLVQIKMGPLFFEAAKEVFCLWFVKGQLIAHTDPGISGM